MRRNLLSLLALMSLAPSVALPVAFDMGRTSALTSFGSAQAAPLPPNLLYSSLLNGLKIRPETGELSFDTMWAMFLPAGSYGPTEDSLKAVLRRKDGTELAHFKFYVTADAPPYSQLTHYEVEDKVGESRSSFYKVDKGDYILDWYVKDQQFMTFPFSVEHAASPDPYHPNDTYSLRGPWQDMAYFTNDGLRADRGVYFKLWMRNTASNQNKDVPIMAELRRGGKVFANLAGPVKAARTFGIGPAMSRIDLTLFRSSDGGLLNYGEFVSKDGKHDLTLWVNGKVYGHYPYTIAGGKFVPTGRQVRSGTNPLSLIEGGPDTFWIQKQ